MQTSLFFLISLLLAAPLGVPMGAFGGAEAAATAGLKSAGLKSPGIFTGEIKPLLMKQDAVTLKRLADNAEANGHTNAAMLRAASNLKSTGNREGIPHGVPLPTPPKPASGPVGSDPLSSKPVPAPVPMPKAGLTGAQKGGIAAGAVIGTGAVIGAGFGINSAVNSNKQA